MATRTLEAVYEHGVLRPLTPLVLDEGEKVQVTVESYDVELVSSLELAGRVLDGLTDEQIAEFESHLKRPRVESQPISQRGADSLAALMRVYEGWSKEEIAEFEGHLKRPLSMFELES